MQILGDICIPGKSFLFAIYTKGSVFYTSVLMNPFCSFLTFPASEPLLPRLWVPVV